MKPREFYEQIQSIEQPECLTLQPLRVIADHVDARAARLLLFLIAEWPDMTQGEAEEILGTALWWAKFWASAWTAEQQSEAAEDSRSAAPPEAGASHTEWTRTPQ